MDSGLPKIKCSSCGVEIDIMQLADHVCATAAPTSTPLSPKLERAATLDGPSFGKRSQGFASSSRTAPPPRIDSNAASESFRGILPDRKLNNADKPFRPINPSPASNYSDPKSQPFLSPALTPAKSPFKMNRSATTPVLRPRAPPSPDLPANMDCAFPPFPTARSATPQSPRPQTRDRLHPDARSRNAEPSPLFAPLSPRTNGGENVLKRMNSIAPGPFDGKDQRPSTSSVPRLPPLSDASGGHKRAGSKDSIMSSKGLTQDRTSLKSNSSRSSTYSNRSIGLPSRPKPGVKEASVRPPSLSPAIERDEGVADTANRAPSAFTQSIHATENSRSNTYPVRQESMDRNQPPSRPRRPSDVNIPMVSGNSQSTGLDFRSGNSSPPRKPPHGGPPPPFQQESVSSGSLQPPPLRTFLTKDDTPSNPLHTPSDSGLSDDSYASSSFRSIASSRSSPPASEAGYSQTSKSYHGEDRNVAILERTASPESYERPMAPPSRPFASAYADMPESPMDPAIQMGFASNRRQSPSRNPQTRGRSPPKKAPEATPQPQETRRPATKGQCRGCSEPIVGKSVKDSSGRLTGRYHKHCFSCRTCRNPFPTAEFYVYDNFPYCERHYHELNGSLCRSCDRGIEGQYLETDARQKFHPRCFTCTTCRVVLRDDYFEVGGQKYCDRHAQRAAAPPQDFLGPGGYRPRNVQKRRTRLMMMA